MVLTGPSEEVAGPWLADFACTAGLACALQLAGQSLGAASLVRLVATTCEAAVAHGIAGLVDSATIQSGRALTVHT